MALIYVTAAGTIPVEDAAAIDVLETGGGYTIPVVEDTAVTNAAIDAATGVIIGRNVSLTAMRALSRLTQAGGCGRPLLFLNRALGINLRVTNDEFGSGSSITQMFVRSEGEIPLDEPAGTVTIMSPSGTLSFIQGSVAPGAVLYTNQSAALGSKYGHLVVPAGAALQSGGNATAAVGFACWPSSEHVGKVNALFEQFLWRTALATLGPPEDHEGAGAVDPVPAVTVTQSGGPYEAGEEFTTTATVTYATEVDWYVTSGPSPVLLSSTALTATWQATGIVNATPATVRATATNETGSTSANLTVVTRPTVESINTPDGPRALRWDMP